VSVDANGLSTAPPVPDVVYCWMPVEGDTVSVLDYPSPLPLGVVESIERDASGAATTYWIWMLDGCRIALEAETVAQRLGRP
jgi:hypothetical protein